jgi:hypothetical protein
MVESKGGKVLQKMPRGNVGSVVGTSE